MPESASPPPFPPTARPVIRGLHLSDLPSVYRVCHATGLNGEDASAAIADPDLLGHIYAGPYAVLEPECAFVAERCGKIVGYVLATADSAAFHRRTEAEWFPPLRARYPVPAPSDASSTATFLRALHRGHPPPTGLDLRRFPAHLHVDLLPEAQGQGCGRALIEHLCSALRLRGVPGVHLYVATANPRAIQFYERIGLKRVDETPGALGYARSLAG